MKKTYHIRALLLCFGMLSAGLSAVGGEDKGSLAPQSSAYRNTRLRQEHYLLLYASPETSYQDRLGLVDSIIDLFVCLDEPRQVVVYRRERALLLERSGSFRQAFYAWKFLVRDLSYDKSFFSEEKGLDPQYVDTVVRRAYISMVSDAMQAGLDKEGIEVAYEFLYRYPSASASEKASVYANLGSLYTYSGREKEACTYHRQALAFLAQDPSEENSVYRNLAGWFYTTGQTDSALCYLQKIRPEHLDASNGDLDYYYNNLACIYSSLGQSDMARLYFEKALASTNENAEKSFRKTRILLNVGNQYYKIGNFDEAEPYIREAIVLSEELDYGEVAYQAHLKYALLLWDRGESDSAYKELLAAYMQRDSVWNRENEDAAFNLRKEFELQQVQSDLQQAELQNLQKKLTITVLSFATFFLIIGFGILLWRLRREKTEINARSRDLSEKADRLLRNTENKNRRLDSVAVSNTYKDQILDQIRIQTESMRKTLPKLSKAEMENHCTRIIRLIRSCQTEDKWRTFLREFEASYPYFFDVLQEREPSLTKSERRLAALLASGLNAKEIAELISRTPSSVETFIYRLRKKLNIEHGVRTGDFFDEIKKADEFRKE